MTSLKLAKLGMYRAAAIKYAEEEREDFKRYETLAGVVLLVIGTLVMALMYGEYGV